MDESDDEENKASDRIRNELSGEAGSVVQIGKAGSVTFNHASSSADSAKQGNDDERADQQSSGCLFIAALAAVAVIWFLFSQCGSGQDVPEESDPWPQGVSSGALMNAAREAVHTCSEAVVLAPANCPQAHQDVSSVQNVRWVLRGDPMDGAHIAYRDDLFYVYGNAVMTVSYQYQWGDPKFAVEIVPFLVKLSSDGSRLVSLEGLNDDPPEPIVKRRPEVSDERVASALRGAFADCAATSQPAMPPTCPVDTAVVPGSPPVHWSFDGDPALNTRQTFDQNSGLITVVGSYAATARYSDLITDDASRTSSGYYRASLVVESGELKVLQIEGCATDCSG
ncbi:hypothetical protein OU415_03825 [Saccharopolyspora sp. WRP15-2]|uniref:Ig-like domain-containing protein n=1 Tax=Saccharopolyspora oryzae TaxID=2997343 RepID=A0ABT4US57_9PSEU|nr:hypothetical protein [Saccharopolyspora oryzae]MDA3624553.1 hypothetical protein [Saccharopolyspora oryzae]